MTIAVTVMTVPAADVELAADRLMQAGAFAVEERGLGGAAIELWTVLAESDASARELLGDIPTAWSLRTESVDPSPADTNAMLEKARGVWSEWQDKGGPVAKEMVAKIQTMVKK